jgi:large subunit ribosomal protein L5
MLDTASYTPRLLAVYREEIRAKMKEEFGYSNDMMIPRLDKVVLNIGCGAAAVRDSKKAKSAQQDLLLVSAYVKKCHWVRKLPCAAHVCMNSWIV